MALDITIPSDEKLLKTKESQNVLVAIDNYKKTDMSMNPKKRDTILKTFDAISQIESRGKNVVSDYKDSTAKGYFQFNDPSIPTAIQRYKNLTNTSPEWLNNLEKTKDIMSLDYDQQKALAIANTAMSKGNSIMEMNKIAESGKILGNQDVYDLYINYHHTISKDKKRMEEAKNNAYKILGLFETILKKKPPIPNKFFAEI